MDHIAFLSMRFKTEEDAVKAASRYQLCPKIYFWGNKEETAYIILNLLEDNKFWSDFIAEKPQMSFGGGLKPILSILTDYSLQKLSEYPMIWLMVI